MSSKLKTSVRIGLTAAIFAAVLFPFASCSPAPLYESEEQIIEAEDCFITRGEAKNGYVECKEKKGSSVDFRIIAPEEGFYELAVKYRTKESSDSTWGLFVDGHLHSKMYYKATTDKSELPKTKYITVHLDKGNNNISFKYTEGDTATLFDSFTFTPSKHSVSMVVAPHEDDEILAFAGSIMEKKSRGDTVKVVFMTNGDYFDADIAPVRIAESVKALEHLGVTREDIIVMGYGDVQIGEYYFSGESTDVMTSHAGRKETSGAPDLNLNDYHCLDTGSHASYTAKNFSSDLENIIKTIRPSEIFTVSKFEWHPDHQYSHMFVDQTIKKIQETKKYHPTVNQSVVHGEKDTWPERLRLNSDGQIIEDEFTDPFPSGGNEFNWSDANKIKLTDDMIKLKYKAVSEFVTQNEGTDKFEGNSEFNYAFVKADEFFWSVQY